LTSADSLDYIWYGYGRLKVGLHENVSKSPVMPVVPTASAYDQNVVDIAARIQVIW